MSILNLTPAQLRKAADLKEKIEALEQELNALHGAPSPAVSAAAPAQNHAETPQAAPFARKTKFSAAGLARIAAAQRLRWARAKKGKAGAAVPAKRGPRKMGAAARARIAAAQRARWAKYHAAKGL